MLTHARTRGHTHTHRHVHTRTHTHAHTHTRTQTVYHPPVYTVTITFHDSYIAHPPLNRRSSDKQSGPLESISHNSSSRNNSATLNSSPLMKCSEMDDEKDTHRFICFCKIDHFKRGINTPN